ncbi:MAG: prepilin-type cleavage/methylation domain-containing protein [Sulfurovum sp.]|nr:MAG: prepilin-type cleavage/methylation domain-containing protein [Sulfurovum sp.]
MKRQAFTMIELVMAIVVIGILAALAMPRLERDIRQEAADSILSAIRYAQHYALMDNVIDPNELKWQRKFWRFGFQGCSDNGIFYYVASDKDTGGNIDAGEEIIDPATNLPMIGLNGAPCASDLSGQTNASANIFITKRFGITSANISWGGGCTGGSNYIGFDNLGRPHRGYTASVIPNYASLVTTDCNLTLTFEQDDIAPLIFSIEKETGRVSVAG